MPRFSAFPLSRTSGALALSLGCLLFAQGTFAQTTACTAADLRGMQRHWLFGNNTAIDFGVSGSSYTASAITPPVAMGGEGNTVASLGDGTLQFWVATGAAAGIQPGIRGDVLDRNNDIMPNGNGIFGGNSAAQSFLALPAPTAPGKYFILGNSAFQGASNDPSHPLYSEHGGLAYSVVDMALNSGLGDVTTKNTVLIDPATTPIANKMHEGMTAVPNAAGTGYWVITAEAGTTNVRTFEFDSNGPVGAPVLSAVQDRVPPIIHGTFRASPTDPSLIVYTNNDADPNNTLVSEIYLLRINRTTGAVTQEVKWTVPLLSTIGFAADFSPSGNHVYFSTIRRLQPDGLIYRYDITSGNAATIEASQLQIPSGGEAGLLQRGPDGAMWVKKYGGMLRITDPDGTPIATDIATPGNQADFSIGLPQIAGACAPWQATPRASAPVSVPVNHPLALLATAGLVGLMVRRRTR